jgi:hypothetical protein
VYIASLQQPICIQLSQLPLATPHWNLRPPETLWFAPVFPLVTETGMFTILLEPIEREFKVFKNFKIY